MRVDNSFGDHSGLHIENDYYSWGGITRPATFEVIGPVHRAPCNAHQTEEKMGSFCCCAGPKPAQAERSAQPVIVMEGVVVDLGDHTLAAETTETITTTLKGLEVESWSAHNPALYALAAFLKSDGDIIDDLIDRVGFRSMRVKGKKVLLNGEPLSLRGFNRHESHAAVGSALPLALITQDIEHILSSGANVIRTSHYPNDQRFLDLCDELGVYVWEESHARDISFKHPAYADQMATNTEEMVAWHFNHPSIIMWGMFKRM